MRTIPPREKAATELRSALMEDRGRGISGKTWPAVERALAEYRTHLSPNHSKRLLRYFDPDSDREFTHEGADRLIATLEREHRAGPTSWGDSANRARKTGGYDGE